METISKAIGAAILVMAMIFVVAVAGGTFLWMIYDTSVPAFLPGLVERGILASDLTWWQSVQTVWVAGLLIKGTTTVKSN
tara:strand:+ start:19 stop:258 length:240 start_codon:yes stop_codon:yes gene_type:complete